MKDKVRKLFLLSILSFASAFGLPMDPQKIEELLDTMNRPKCEMTIPDYDDSGDGPKKYKLQSATEVKVEK